VEYRVFREINGTPLLDSHLTGWFDGKGKAILAGVSAIVPDVTGQPGSEQPGPRSRLVERLLDWRDIKTRFENDVVREFGASNTAIVHFSEFVYARPPDGAWRADPVHMFEFSVSNGREITRRYRWAYRVDDPFVDRYEYTR